MKLKDKEGNPSTTTRKVTSNDDPSSDSQGPLSSRPSRTTRKMKRSSVGSAPPSPPDTPPPSSSSTTESPAASTKDIFRQFAPPLATQGSGRRSRQYFTSSLPTLDETSSSETGSSLDEDDEEVNRRDVVGPLMSTENLKRSRKLVVAASNKLSAAPKTPHERVQALHERGDDLASRGEEEEALIAYKKALKITRNETARVKNQLKQVDGKHPSTVESIASRLHEDWLNVGRSIADIRQKMAILFERVGDYDRALACLTEAQGVYKRQVHFVEKSRSKNNLEEIKSRYCNMNIAINSMKVSRDSFTDRKALHEDILSLRRLLPVEDDPEERRELYMAIEDKIRLALDVESDILGKDHPQVADSLSILATLAMEQGDMVQAMDHMIRAVAITKETLGLKHPVTGEMYLQIARLYATQVPVDEARAVEFYDKAVAVFRASERNPRFVGSTLNEISVIRIRQHKYDEAIRLLGEALESFNSDPKERKEGEIKTDTVQIWRNLAEAYSHKKEFQKSSEALIFALDLQRDGRKTYDTAMAEANVETTCPPPPAYLLVDDGSIADTLRRLGKAYAGLGNYNEALSVYSEALLIHRAGVVKAVKSDSGRPNQGLPERQDQLAHTLYCIAEAKEAVGSLDEALRIYGESMQLRLFSDAHRQAQRLNMIHCAMCLRGIGNIHLARREYEMAQKVLEDALSYCSAHGKNKMSIYIVDLVVVASSHTHKSSSQMQVFRTTTRLWRPFDNALMQHRKNQQTSSSRRKHGSLTHKLAWKSRLASLTKPLTHSHA